MQHRVTASAALLAAAALAATTPAVHSAFTTAARPGEARFAAAAQFAPRNVAPPAISGTPRQGSTLMATSGTWARALDDLTGTWLRDGTSVGTGSSRVLEAADVGHRLVYRVTATNAGGSTTADSPATAVVLPPLPQNTTRPSIDGSATVGSVLTADEGAWSGEPTQLRLPLDPLRGEHVPLGRGRHRARAPGHRRRRGRHVHARGDRDERRRRHERPEQRHRHRQPRDLHPRPLPQPRRRDAHGRGRRAARGALVRPHATQFPNPAAATRCASGDGIPLTTGGTWTDRDRRRRRVAAVPRHGRRRVRGRDALPQRHDERRLRLDRRDGRRERPRRHAACGAVQRRRGLPRPRLAPRPVRARERRRGRRGRASTASTWRCSATSRRAPPTAASTSGFTGPRSHLRDTSTPQVTSTPTGGIATDAQLEGVEDLAFTATDAGAGLYRVRVRIGTEEVATSPLRADPGRCSDVDPGDGDAVRVHRPPPVPALARGQPEPRHEHVAGDRPAPRLPRGRRAQRDAVVDRAL